MRQCIRAAFFLCDHNIDVDLALASDCLLHLLARAPMLANHFANDDVAHCEAKRGHRNGAVA